MNGDADRDPLCSEFTFFWDTILIWGGGHQTYVRKKRLTFKGEHGTLIKCEEIRTHGRMEILTVMQLYRVRYIQLLFVHDNI